MIDAESIKWSKNLEGATSPGASKVPPPLVSTGVNSMTLRLILVLGSRAAKTFHACLSCVDTIVFRTEYGVAALRVKIRECIIENYVNYVEGPLQMQ